MTDSNVELKEDDQINGIVCNNCKLSDTKVLLLTSIDLIKRGVEIADNRLIGRALHSYAVLRRSCKLNNIILILNSINTLTEGSLGEDCRVILSILLNVVKSSNEDIDMKNTNTVDLIEDTDTKMEQLVNKLDISVYSNCLPECVTFLGSLALIHLLDSKIKSKIETLNTFDKQLTDSLELSVALYQFVRKFTHQSMDLLSAKAIFYYGRVNELCKKLGSIRNEILASYRIATLHHNLMTQATCLNLILRSYILENLYDLGLKALEKLTYPEQLSSNAQQARYLYYSGILYAMKLEYSKSYSCLTQAIRKAPHTKGKSGLSFALSSQKFAIVVQLLMGGIPERFTFNTSSLRRGLLPYLYLTQAVRSGDIREFETVIEKNRTIFENDRAMALIQRLAHNVIRAGLRTICVSYSRIYLDDIADKLGWGNTDDIEGVVAKAILDKVIDARINDEMRSVEMIPQRDQYGSDVMLRSLHSRIAFCLLLRSDAIKAMEYPDVSTSTKPSDSDEEARRLSQEEIEAAVRGIDDGMI
ncbi:PCI domain-containing protein [Cryptosporidium muris RN66]|uniref:PCI domain-containing protein n=1 Tax=Cryptosporidium muris (strain RN66) TaxID=441375 RepID=B6AHE0_CRYMR|nr:PCI domain-containing protein [Cryptosporidium muris RN66]EEA07635.1 PCI domain-containing protein [Cryptosporidium muris RN66]|eukprot:XP_002141984.1 PCI domain-containing protein [Cryptosporidium muris RN66]